MKRFMTAKGICGLLLAMFALAQPAEARRFRFHFVPTVRHHSEAAAPTEAQPAVESPQDVAEREHKIELIREGRLIERHPGETEADYDQRKESWIKQYRDEAVAKSAKTEAAPTRSLPAGTGWGLLSLVGLAIFGRKIVKGIYGLVQSDAPPSRDDANQRDQPDAAGFDQRVAQRLAEMRQGNDLGLTSPPAASTFGRKLA